MEKKAPSLRTGTTLLCRYTMLHNGVVKQWTISRRWTGSVTHSKCQDTLGIRKRDRLCTFHFQRLYRYCTVLIALLKLYRSCNDCSVALREGTESITWYEPQERYANRLKESVQWLVSGEWPQWCTLLKPNAWNAPSCKSKTRKPEIHNENIVPPEAHCIWWLQTIRSCKRCLALSRVTGCAY